jgi:hypothetical protein
MLLPRIQAIVNECHEIRILESLYFIPNCSWNRESDEITDVVLDAFDFNKKSVFDGPVNGVKMKNEQFDEQSLGVGNWLLVQIGIRLEHAE